MYACWVGGWKLCAHHLRSIPLKYEIEMEGLQPYLKRLLSNFLWSIAIKSTSHPLRSQYRLDKRKGWGWSYRHAQNYMCITSLCTGKNPEAIRLRHNSFMLYKTNITQSSHTTLVAGRKKAPKERAGHFTARAACLECGVYVWGKSNHVGKGQGTEKRWLTFLCVTMKNGAGKIW